MRPNERERASGSLVRNQIHWCGIKCVNQAAAPAAIATTSATTTPTPVAAPDPALRRTAGAEGGGGGKEPGATASESADDRAASGTEGEAYAVWDGGGKGSGSSSRAARLPTTRPGGSDACRALSSRFVPTAISSIQDVA